MLKYSLIIASSFFCIVLLGQETTTLKEFGNSPLVLVSQKIGTNPFPVWFEETDSLVAIEGKKDSTYIEFYRKYENRMTPGPKQVRKTKFRKGVISVYENDTLKIQVDRTKSESEGILGGVKGTVIRRLIPSKIKEIPASESYLLKSDSLNFIIYKPELGIIELQGTKTYQKRRVLSSFYKSICSSPSGLSDYKFLNRNLEPGDRLQILFSIRKLQPEQKSFVFEPSQLMDIEIISKNVFSGSAELKFKSSIVNLENSTEYDLATSKLELYPEGFRVDESVQIADMPVEKNLVIYPVSMPIKPHPYNQTFDLSGPLIEAFWDAPVSFDGIELNTIAYWNSVNASRVSYLPEFAIPWRDDGDNYIGKPVYLKLGTKELGNPYAVPENPELHFSKIDQNRDTLFLDIYSPQTMNIKIMIEQLSKGKPSLPLKKTFGLNKGITSLKFAKADIEMPAASDLVIYQLDAEEEIMRQKFRLMDKRQ
ncbi:MAG: hypothetical protein WED33_07855 [Bacteroidia bacterium]